MNTQLPAGAVDPGAFARDGRDGERAKPGISQIADVPDSSSVLAIACY
ncbi:hypothetical protein [Sphingomonas sp. Root710]|nr:hypothetical protein [Sphingomonas sp. Root710]